VETILLRALAAAARAFADEIDRNLTPSPQSETARLTAGSLESMVEVLRSVAAINDHQTRGATDSDMREIARRAGMDPRGMAGYYAANLLEKRSDGTRWLAQLGRDRLQALSRVVLLDPAVSDRPGSVAAPVDRET
jgi:hypothetical protein